MEVLEDSEALLADGFEAALVGYAERFSSGPLALYDRDECIQILIDRDGMTYEEAGEYFCFNVTGSWVGEKTPVFARFLGIPLSTGDYSTPTAAAALLASAAVAGVETTPTETTKGALHTDNPDTHLAKVCVYIKEHVIQLLFYTQTVSRLGKDLFPIFRSLGVLPPEADADSVTYLIQSWIPYGELTDVMAVRLAERFSETDMDVILEFYNSDIGRRLTTANNALQGEVSDYFRKAVETRLVAEHSPDPAAHE